MYDVRQQATRDGTEHTGPGKRPDRTEFVGQNYTDDEGDDGRYQVVDE